MNSRENEIKNLLEKDSKYEGRDRYFIDVDRIINEGLSGGTVVKGEDNTIEQARDLNSEEPPVKVE